ncbi:MAG TPA: nitroreductase family protein [Gaiellaceae bacterium]|nr:nitroreductase family protein [Gaiellaceae bacterium]
MDTYLAVASKRDWRSYADRPVPPEVERRILDAGRVAGSAMNRQPWDFVVVESPEARERVAQTVYAQDNVRSAALVIAIATPGGASTLDVGRAMQNMFLAAWNDGVVSCPNGMPEPDAAARALGLEDGFLPVSIPSFGYPKRPLEPESKSAEEWIGEANRKPLEELVRRI